VGNTKQQPTAHVPFHVVDHDSLTDIEQQTNQADNRVNRSGSRAVCASFVGLIKYEFFLVKVGICKWVEKMI
jgi:hypothetical protein